MASVAIREWRTEDSIEDLTALLHRAYAPLGAGGLNYTAVDQSVDDTKRRIAQGICAVATLDHAVVGTLTVCGGPFPHSRCGWYRLPRVAFAQQFAVEAAHQRHGIGSLLMAWAETWARYHAYAELAVDTAEPAGDLVAYYARRGYRVVDHVRWPGKRYRSVVLSKTLAAT